MLLRPPHPSCGTYRFKGMGGCWIIAEELRVWGGKADAPRPDRFGQPSDGKESLPRRRVIAPLHAEACNAAHLHGDGFVSPSHQGDAKTKLFGSSYEKAEMMPWLAMQLAEGWSAPP